MSKCEEGHVLDEICMIYIYRMLHIYRMLRATAKAQQPSLERVKGHQKTINDLRDRGIQLLDANMRDKYRPLSEDESNTFWLYVGKLEGAAFVIKLLCAKQDWNIA